MADDSALQTTVTVDPQAATILGGVLGGTAGYFLGGRKVLWTAVGALLGSLVMPSAANAAVAALPPAEPTVMKTIQLAAGKTIIYRAQVGDLITVLAPSGWGPPAATSNVPGFLEVESSDVNSDSTTFKVTAGGQGQISMDVGGEVAVLSVEVV